MHSHAGRDVLRRIHDVYRESTQSQLAQNIQHLFHMLPSHSPFRAPFVGILTQNLPMADAITLTATSSAYINRARRSPPADSSPLFARYPHGVHRDKVKNVERDRTIALLTEHALIKYDAAQRPSYLHYDTCSEFYELYRVHMPDICSCILALVEAEVIDRDDDLSSFMRRNLDLVEEYSSTFLARVARIASATLFTASRYYCKLSRTWTPTSQSGLHRIIKEHSENPARTQVFSGLPMQG
jgi:hypothetical protein